MNTVHARENAVIIGRAGGWAAAAAHALAATHTVTLLTPDSARADDDALAGFPAAHAPADGGLYAVLRAYRPAVVVIAPDPPVWGAFLACTPAALEAAVYGGLEAAAWAFSAGLRVLADRARSGEGGQPGGRLIALVSVVGEMPFAGAAVAGAVHAGIAALCGMAAVEAGAFGATANTIAIGPLEGDPWLNDPATRAHVAAGTPTGRPATRDELAAVIAFTASPAAASLNGARVRVDGGYTRTRSAGNSALQP
jgi:NAD(P)-dependent dehydrogenase (short-subunit alcohol dehydrogenase family)